MEGGIEGVVSTSGLRSFRKAPAGVEVERVGLYYSDWKFIVNPVVKNVNQ